MVEPSLHFGVSGDKFLSLSGHSAHVTVGLCHQVSPPWGRLHLWSTLRSRVAVGHVGSSHLLGRDLWYSCEQRAAREWLLIHHVSCSSWTWPLSHLSHPVLPPGYLPWHPHDHVGRGPAPGTLGFRTHVCKRWILAPNTKCFCPKCDDKNLIIFKEDHTGPNGELCFPND